MCTWVIETIVDNKKIFIPYTWLPWLHALYYLLINLRENEKEVNKYITRSLYATQLHVS